MSSLTIDTMTSGVLVSIRNQAGPDECHAFSTHKDAVPIVLRWLGAGDGTVIKCGPLEIQGQVCNKPSPTN